MASSHHSFLMRRNLQYTLKHRKMAASPTRNQMLTFSLVAALSWGRAAMTSGESGPDSPGVRAKGSPLVVPLIADYFARRSDCVLRP